MIKEDLRVVRTKRLLTNALKDLLKEKSFDKITVNDICEMALVHRATFYNHFTDKTALIDFIFDEIQEGICQRIVKLDNQTDAKHSYLDIIEMIIDYCLNNRNDLRLILKNSTEEFQNILFENIKRGMDYLAAKNKNIATNNENTQAVKCFLTGGISALCVGLVMSDKDVDKGKLMDYLGQVMDASLNA